MAGEEKHPRRLRLVCVGSSRHLILMEHLELIFRPTECSSTSRATPAVPVMSHMAQISLDLLPATCKSL